MPGLCSRAKRRSQSQGQVAVARAALRRLLPGADDLLRPQGGLQDWHALQRGHPEPQEVRRECNPRFLELKPLGSGVFRHSQPQALNKPGPHLRKSTSAHSGAFLFKRCLASCCLKMPANPGKTKLVPQNVLCRFAEGNTGVPYICFRA